MERVTKTVSSVFRWLMGGGIGRWVVAIVVLVVVGSFLRPLMGPATDELFALLVVFALLVTILRFMLFGKGRRR